MQRSDAGGDTILHTAAWTEGAGEIADLLIDELNMDIDIRNYLNNSPLHGAVSTGCLSMARYLLDKGANSAAGHLNGQSAIGLAHDEDLEDFIGLFENYPDNYRPLDDLIAYPTTDFCSGMDQSKNRQLNEELLVHIASYGRKMKPLKLLNMKKHLRISSITYSPVLDFDLTTMYERRETKKVTSAWDGKAEGTNPSVTDENRVRPWETELPPVDGWNHDSLRYTMRESIDVYTCSSCGGAGGHTCPECGGKVLIKCPDCSGRGYVDCTDCDSSGMVSCPQCGGSGRETFKETTTHSEYDQFNNLKSSHNTYRNLQKTCRKCGGSGRQSCPTCNGKKIKTCSRCGGRGMVYCSNCDDGKVACNACDRTGRMMSRIMLERRLKHHSRRATTNQAAAGNMLDDWTVDYEAVSPEILWLSEVPRLEAGHMNGNGYSEAFDDMLESAGLYDPFGEDDGETRILKQKWVISRFNGWLADIEYKGETGRVYIYGDDNSLICLSNSDIFH